MDAFTAVSSSLDLGPSARSRRVAALAAAALRSDAMFPPRYSRTSSLSDMPVFNNALTAAESTSIFGMVIAAVSASWDGPFVDVVAAAPRSIFILAGKPASWTRRVDSRVPPSSRAGNRGGRVECASRRVARTCAGVCEFVRCACDGGVGREVSLGHARWGQCDSTLRAHLFFSVVCLAVEGGLRPPEESGSANRILASLWFLTTCIFSRTRLTSAFSVTCVEPNTKSQCQNISSCVSNNPGCR